jgi:hypothetical protein
MEGCKADCCRRGTLHWHEYCRRHRAEPFADRKVVSKHKLNVDLPAHLLCHKIYGPKNCHGALITASPMVWPGALLTTSIHPLQPPQAGECTCPHTCGGPEGDGQSGMWKHRCNRERHPQCSTRCSGNTFLSKEEVSCFRTPIPSS